MVFSSFAFLWIFLPAVLIGAVLTHRKGSNLFLLAASLFFYAWGEPKYIVLLLFSVTLNYLAGLLIGRCLGTRLAGKASILGGVILILIGCKILFGGGF